MLIFYDTDLRSGRIIRVSDTIQAEASINYNEKITAISNAKELKDSPLFLLQ